MVTVAKRIDAIQTGFKVSPDYKNFLVRRIKRSISQGSVKDAGLLVGRLCPLFLTSDKKNYFAVKVPVDLDDLNELCTIHYINNVEYLDLHSVPMKVPVQTFVWKSPNADPYHMAGIAKDVLIKVMLKKHKIVGSDKTQSTDGERFWRSLVDTALTTFGPDKIFVYLHDTRFDKLVQLPRITHISELDELTVWGTTPEFSKTRLLISLRKLDI